MSKTSPLHTTEALMNLKDFNPENFNNSEWYRFRGIVTCDFLRKTFYPVKVEQGDNSITFVFEFKFDFKVLMKTFELHTHKGAFLSQIAVNRTNKHLTFHYTLNFEA
jgi:hypothetical protein